MSLPDSSAPQHSGAASRLGFNPVLLNADRRKALPKEPPSDDYANPPSKPFWRTKRGKIWFSVLAIIIVVGVVVGGAVGATVGKRKGKGNEAVPLDTTSTTTLPFSRPVLTTDPGQPAGHSVEATTSSPETSAPVGITPTPTTQPIGSTPVGPAPFPSAASEAGEIQTQPQFQTLAPPR